MLESIKWFLRRRSYQPLNHILISKAHLLHNYKYLSKVNPKLKITPVLKSNAYGHGILEIGKILDSLNCPFLCVDSIYEAYQLYLGNIKTPILIMGYVDPVNLKFKQLPFQYCVWDIDFCRALNNNNWIKKVHVFVDTGMGREGIQIQCTVKNVKCTVGPNNCLLHFLEELKKLKNLEIVGVMSHLASANVKNSLQTTLQIKNFSKALKICQKLGVRLKYRHISASAGLFSTKNLDCNIVRVGKALYGIDPLDNNTHIRERSFVSLRTKDLRPVLKFTTKIVQIKQLKKGDRVGYEGTFQVQKVTRIGILPVGYNDGLDRRLSNKGIVQVNKKDCPIVGLISMNVSAISLDNVKDAQVGDIVTIYSDISSKANSIQNTSKLVQTVPYDIMVNLVSTTRREVVD